MMTIHKNQQLRRQRRSFALAVAIVVLLVVVDSWSLLDGVQSFSPPKISNTDRVSYNRGFCRRIQEKQRTFGSASSVLSLSSLSSLEDVATVTRAGTTSSASSSSSPTVNQQQETGSTTGVPKDENKSVTSSSSSTTATTSFLQKQKELKSQLLDLLPRMTGQESEFRQVESLVNQLEEAYQPVQTLDFLNLLQQGDWQLLFSTNLAATHPNPQRFRLRELYQTVTCQNLQGTVATKAQWDLAEHGDGQFRATGTFTVQNTYEIQQALGAGRMLLTLQDHVLEPANGSEIPQDVPALVGLLHRSMPKELFDASEHAVDTTFLDADLKIVRYTGPRFEGTRDIFIRRGSWTIDPSLSTTTSSASIKTTRANNDDARDDECDYL